MENDEEDERKERSRIFLDDVCVASVSRVNTSPDGQHTFVANDLERKIRESFHSEKSGIITNIDLYNINAPDIQVLTDIEQYAKSIASNLDVILRELRGSLYGMSDLTLEASECYANSIASACDSIDAVIKNFYTMLAKTEELNAAMNKLKPLAEQVKDIKRIVDLFEVQFLTSNS